MPGSPTTPGRPSACVGALGHIAFHYTDSVGTRNQFSIAAQWLACTFPCRRFADILTDACARLGADVVRYSFIVVDLHHLLLAGLPAHLCKNSADCGPDAILDPLYCGYGNDDLHKDPHPCLIFRYLVQRSGFHTASGHQGRFAPTSLSAGSRIGQRTFAAPYPIGCRAPEPAICYYPLFVFNQRGDVERYALRPGNVHSADGWRAVLEQVIARSRWPRLPCRDRCSRKSCR